MRREGYELQVGQPQVIFKDIDGKRSEPIEELTIDLPEDKSGTAIEMVARRKGDMKNMVLKGDRVILDFEIPSRGLIGLRTELITATSGEAVVTHIDLLDINHIKVKYLDVKMVLLFLKKKGKQLLTL
jgi:GTP-binding protein